MSAKKRFTALVRECNDRFRYLSDPPGIELLKTVQEFEADGGGDCKDGGFWIAQKMGTISKEEGALYGCVGFTPQGRHFWLEFEDRFSRLVGDWTSGWVNGMPEGWRRDERFPWVGDHWEKPA